jgi:hypothetical protein
MIRSSARDSGVHSLVGTIWELVEMAKDARKQPQGEGEDESVQVETAKTCTVCGTKLSSYNPGPNCWQHTIGYPWRGPSAKPRYD